MKKKILIALLLALGVCGSAFALSACNSGNNGNNGNPDDTTITDGNTTMSVSGKTFVFYDVEISFSSEVPEEIKNEITGSLPAVKQNMEGESLSFNTDGNAYILGNAIGTWVQDGETVTVTQPAGSVQTITVKGDTVEITSTESGITMTLVFKYNPGGGDHGGGADNPGSGGNSDYTGMSDITDAEWEAALNFTANTNYTLTQQGNVMGFAMSISIVREGDKAEFTSANGDVTYYCKLEGGYYYVSSSGAYSQITETEYNNFFSQLKSFPKSMFEYSSAEGGFVNKETYEANGSTVSDALLVFNQQGCLQSIQCTMIQNGITAAIDVLVVYGNASVTLPEFNEGGETTSGEPSYPEEPDLEREAMEVKGNTFFYSELSIEYDGELTPEMEIEIENVRSSINEYMAEKTITFNADGTAVNNKDSSVAKWNQEGGIVYVSYDGETMQFIVGDNYFEYTQDVNGLTVTYLFVIK